MTYFTDKAPGIMALLMRDFDLDVLSAAAILGNLGHESGGFKSLQERKPLVPGSRGGYGWAQWTGPRRRQFEAYAKRNNLDPTSDKANYGWLFVELTTTEKAAIPAVKKAGTLSQKVRAFEKAFERAGIKHYDSRDVWAVRALDAYNANPVLMPDAAGETPDPDVPKPVQPPPPDIVPTTSTQPPPGGFFNALLALVARWFSRRS
jgi:hypothetical protein